MATTHEMGKRLTMIILIFLYITVMYTLEGIYISGQEEMITADRTNIIQQPPEIENPQYYNYSDIVQQQSDPLGIVMGFFEFLIFAPLGLPAWASAILTVTIIICNITLGLLVYVFVRDWIPLLG